MVREDTDPLVLATEAEEALGRGDVAAAVEAYEACVAPAGPALEGVLGNLVPLYVRQGRLVSALRAAEARTFFEPSMESWMQRSSVEEKLGLQDAALASVYEALKFGDNSVSETRLYLLASRLAPLAARAAAEEWARSLPPLPHVARPVRPSSRIRLGYVSGDFKQHVMDRLILPLLRFADQSRFDITCFDNTAKQDAVSAEMRKIEGIRWRFIRGLRDEAVAEQVVDLGIDILVDLSGLTSGNRRDVFRHRPAPVQVTGIGYLPTTGLDCFNWRLADVEDPAQYTEPLWKLPSSTAPLPLCPEVPVSPLPASQNGYLTFGYVNGLRKLSPVVIAGFVELLQAVPDSKLVLMVPGARDLSTAEMVLRRFDPVQERLQLVESAGGRGFVEILGQIDLALDPWPYGGCITSFDCLYHGVPVLTKVPDRRIAADASRLQTMLGMSYMNEDPVQVCRYVSRNLPRLAGLRQHIRGWLQASPAGSPKAWVASLESAYAKMLEVA